VNGRSVVVTTSWLHSGTHRGYPHKVRPTKSVTFQKEARTEIGVVVHALNPTIRRQGQPELCS